MSNKRVALTDFIEADNVDISNNVRAIGFTSEDDRIDASGFNANAQSEFIPGTRVQQVTMTIIHSTASGEVRQVLYPLHRDKTSFYLRWRKHGESSVGPTNPELRGNVTLPTWAEGANRGELETADLTFETADTTGLVWYET